MTAYVDTCVALAYYFGEDAHHERAKRVVEELRRRGARLYASPLTILELHSVISRKLRELKLPPHIRRLDEGARVSALAKLIIKALNVEVVDDEPRTERIDGAKAFHVYQRALELAVALKLKTLDLMHIAYALHLAEKGLASMFATLDGKILKRSRALAKLGLETLTA